MNASKTKYMMFSGSNTANDRDTLSINGVELEQVNYIKFLGLVIDVTFLGLIIFGCSLMQPLSTGG